MTDAELAYTAYSEAIMLAEHVKRTARFTPISCKYILEDSPLDFWIEQLNESIIGETALITTNTEETVKLAMKTYASARLTEHMIGKCEDDHFTRLRRSRVSPSLPSLVYDH